MAMGNGVAMNAFCCQIAGMATLTIRNLPEELADGLKQEARRHRRSVNQQVLVMLEEACLGKNVGAGDVEEELRQIRSLREGSLPMTESEIDAAKEDGRA
jgi:plasmid stability protein